MNQLSRAERRRKQLQQERGAHVKALRARRISLPKYLLVGGLGLASLNLAAPGHAQDAAVTSVPANTAGTGALGAGVATGAANGNAAGAAVGGVGIAAAGDAAAAGVLNPEAATGLLPEDPQAIPAPPPDPAPGLGDARLAQSEAAPELGVIEAIAQALLNNPSRKAARFALEAARQRIGTARSAGGPQVSASGSISGTRGFFGTGTGSTTGISTGGTGTTGTGGISTGGTGTTGGVGTGGTGTTGTGNNILGFNSTESVGLSASVPLYTGGRVKAATRVAEANARAQAAQVLEVDQELVLQVSLAYLDVLRADQLLHVADSNLAVSREQRRVAGVRFGAGAAARLEVLRADTTLAAAQQSRVAAVNTLAQNKGTLNTLLGRAPETPLRPQSLASLALQFGSALPAGAFGLAGGTTPAPSAIAGISVPGATPAITGGAGTGTVITPGTTGAGAGNPNPIVPGIAIPNAPGAGAGGVAAGGTANTTIITPGNTVPSAGIPNITGATGTTSTVAPNVSAPGVTVPGAVGGNAGAAGTGIGTGMGTGTGTTAAGISVPGVTAPGGAGTAVGGSAGTTSSGTVLTAPAGTTGASGGAASTSGGAGTAASLTAQAGILAGQSGVNLRSAAGTGRQSLAVTQAQIQAAQAAVDVARAQKRPNVDLSVSGFLRNPATFLGRFLLGLGLGIAQNVFDSGRTTSQVREAQATVNQLKQNYAGAQQQVAQQIEQSLLSLDSAQRRQASTDVAVVSAAEALRSAQLGYQAGALTSLDVSDAQTALLTSQTNSINTRFDVAQAQASLAASVGVFSPEARAALSRAVDEEAARLKAQPMGSTDTPDLSSTQAPKTKKRRKFLGIF